MSAGVEIESRPDRLVARYRDRVLYEYVFSPELPRQLAPRPYFHPVSTLAGVQLTDHQPEDHRWHLGIAYSWPVVQGLNFWGGPTFVRGEGYVTLENHGQIRHLGWNGPYQELEWLDPDGERIATERRVSGRPEVDAEQGAWGMVLETEIENVTRAPLRFGSPTTEGRELAGYAGLAWRGPKALGQAAVRFDDGRAAADPMGHRSRWLGYTAGGITVTLVEDPSNPGAPNRWFVRGDEYPLVSSSPVFDRALLLRPGEALSLRHRVVFADGVWDANRVPLDELHRQHFEPSLAPAVAEGDLHRAPAHLAHGHANGGQRGPRWSRSGVGP